MKRRTYLAGLGSLATGSALAVGTGAFSVVSGSRRLEVTVAGDNDAYLALSQLGDGKRSVEDGTPEQVEFSFPGLEERLADPSLGLGADSVYEFDRDYAEDGPNPTLGLLRIQNRGTQSVQVYSEHETDSALAVELFDVTDPNRTALRDDPVVLDVGEHVDVGFRIRTFGADIGTFEETLTIVGEATDQ